MRDEERKLIRDMVAGDPAAAHRFFSHWQPRIAAWIAHAGSGSKIEEYSQEVWLHLIANGWHNLLKWRGLYDDRDWHDHSLEAFLRTVTLNKVRRLYEGESDRIRAEIDPADIIDPDGNLGKDPSAQAEGARLMRAFDSCTRRYSERDHRLMSMWWEGHGAQYIGTILGMEPNNVYQRLSYLFRQLRACLAEKLPEYFRHV